MTRALRPVQPAFLRLAEPAEWQAAAIRERVFHDEAAGGLRLGDENATAIPVTEPGGTFGGLTRPTGLAVGPDGRLFLADPVRNRILTYTPHQEVFTELWSAEALLTHNADEPPGPYSLREPRGVAISRDGDLAVADTGHNRVILYTYTRLAVRHIIELPGAEPWDVAYDEDGRLYVAGAAAGRVYRFDRLWRPDEDYAGGQGTFVQPRHLAIDAGGRVLVLDTARGGIAELDENGTPVEGYSLPGLPPLSPPLFRRTFPPALRLDDAGLWLPQDAAPNCPALLLPGLHVERRGLLPDLGLMLLSRPTSVRFPRTGRLVTGQLDSGIVRCAWHRLVLDCDLPAGTGLVIRTFTGPAELEPTRIRDLSEDSWSRPLLLDGDSFPEVLVQSGPGRYLWIELGFRTAGTATPLVRAITVYAPRQSSLSYLPPVFQEDPVSADFLDRFLSYFDTVFDEIESQVAAFTGYLDPDGVPAGEFLAWLGSWLDITFLAEWPEPTRRAFVRRAMELHRRRGTLRGVQETLRLHTGLAAPYPAIIEHFRLRDYAARREAPGDDLLKSVPYLGGLPLTPGEGEFDHHFTVVLPSRAVPDADAAATLTRIIDSQRPAHTRYELRVIEPGLRIGCQSTIGVDALIGPHPAAALGEMALGDSSVLAASLPAAAPTGRCTSATCPAHRRHV
jgi:phage tail-like protein